MMDERKLLQKELDKKDFTHKDALRAFRLWTVVHTDEGGYIDNDYVIHIFKDGIAISDNDRGDGFISLHGEIAKAFVELVKSIDITPPLDRE